MDIVNICKNYFSGFDEIKNFKNNNLKTNVLATLKIISYATGIIPIGFAIAYGYSLRGRINQKFSQTSTDLKTNQRAQDVLKLKQSEIVDYVTKSIQRKDPHIDAFFNITTNDNQVQYIEFGRLQPTSSVDLKLVGRKITGQQTVLGTDFPTWNEQTIDVKNIQSIELVPPPIGRFVKKDDREKLENLGISFDKNGALAIAPELKCEMNIVLANTHMFIKDRDGETIAEINYKQGHYVIVHFPSGN